MVSESAWELGSWPPPPVPMSVFRESSASHVNGEIEDGKKRERARKNDRSEKDSLYVWGLLVELAEKNLSAEGGSRKRDQ